MKQYTQPGLFGEIPPKSYHNTTELHGAELLEATETAKLQEDKILKLFQECRILTPSQCWKMYKLRYNSKVLLTSIRRGISDLTKEQDKLVKTAVKVKGEYGKPEYVWKINEQDV